MHLGSKLTGFSMGNAVESSGEFEGWGEKLVPKYLDIGCRNCERSKQVEGMEFVLLVPCFYFSDR